MGRIGNMLRDVALAEALEPYKFRIRFEDGAEGILALDQLVKFEGVFAPLRDPAEFRKICVNRELGVVCWPNGADLDSEVLYGIVTGSAVRVETPA